MKPLSPAIIRQMQVRPRAMVGLSTGISRVDYDEIRFPRDIFEATDREFFAELPKVVRDLRLPGWALLRLRPKMIGGLLVPVIGWSAAELVTTVVYLTSTSGSNQSWSVLGDWNNSANLVECVGAGASGAAYATTGGSDTALSRGGGGGAYSREVNISLGGSATYRLSAGGAGRSDNNNGNAGPDTWFNGATLGASSVGAKGGSAGTGTRSSGSISAGTPPPGGAAADGVGSTKYSGGAGGTQSALDGTTRQGGGGGAASPSGNGNSGSGATAGSGTPDAFGDGYDAGAGSNGANDGTSPGGNYGGGSGGATGGGAGATSGKGGDALIVITNNPT